MYEMPFGETVILSEYSGCLSQITGHITEKWFSWKHTFWIIKVEQAFFRANKFGLLIGNDKNAYLRHF